MKKEPIERVQRVVTRDRVSALDTKHGVVGKPQAFSNDAGPSVREFRADRSKLVSGVHTPHDRRSRLPVKTPAPASDADNESMSKMRDVVADNIVRLMDAHPEMGTQNALARASKVPQRTIGRIVNKEVTPSIDVLFELAKAFDLQAWQLLVPDLDPKSAPVLRIATAAEEALYQRIIAAAAELSKKPK
jgi:DNA-binding XRE family transcriptional regulator